MVRSCLKALFPVLATLLAVGCGDPRQRQLEQVAKDWCLTIRAAQIIPVYPLTEDLQPGDVFIVSTPIAKQHETYTQKGFLPMDYMAARLPCPSYGEFYKASHTQDGASQVPHPRRYASPQPTGSPASPGQPAPPAMHVTAEPAPASGDQPKICTPLAGFPSYTFTVRGGMGLQMAVPVKGVSVAMALMSADRAHGSVAISGAYTYGVDHETMVAAVREWARAPAVAARLAEIRQGSPDPVYLRVVARVYMARAFTVSVTKAQAWGFAGRVTPLVDPRVKAAPSAGGAVPAPTEGAKSTAGSPGASPNPPPQALVATPDATHESIETQLDKAFASDAIGGSVRIVQASDRAVTMNEVFPRPLVVGYLGVDIPVLSNGDLGTPIATRERLESRYEQAFVRFGGTTHWQNEYLWRKALVRKLGDLDQRTVAARVLVAYVRRAEFEPLADLGGREGDALRRGLEAFWRAADQFICAGDDVAKRFAETLDLGMREVKPHE